MSFTSCKDRRFRIRLFVSSAIRCRDRTRVLRELIQLLANALYQLQIPHLKVILKSSLAIYLECDLLHARRRYNIKGDLPSNLKTGRCSSTFQVRFLRFWEARNVRRGGKLMGVDMLLLDFQYRQLPRSQKTPFQKTCTLSIISDCKRSCDASTIKYSSTQQHQK